MLQDHMTNRDWVKNGKTSVSRPVYRRSAPCSRSSITAEISVPKEHGGQRRRDRRKRDSLVGIALSSGTSFGLVCIPFGKKGGSFVQLERVFQYKTYCHRTELAGETFSP